MMKTKDITLLTTEVNRWRKH